MDEKVDFAIKIDFAKGSEAPSRVFRTATDLIEAFQALDGELVKCIDVKIQPAILLEDIQAGSLKVWLSQRLESVDDQGLKNLDWKPIVGAYLVKAKYRIVDFLRGRTRISDRSELVSLQKGLEQDASETDVRAIPAYAPPDLPKLLQSMSAINGALSQLTSGDAATFITRTSETGFNLDFDLAPKDIEELLTKESVTNTLEIILKVKKPDYLGDSMWELRQRSKTIQCKILDHQWLSRFQNREIDIRPGDSIRAKVCTVDSYDFDGELIGTTYSILSVIEVVPLQRSSQLNLSVDGADSE